MTFWETIERGEYVMFALAAIVVLIVVIWWVRGLSLHKESRYYGFMMQRVRDLVVEGDLENARQVCRDIDSPGSRTIEKGLSYVGRPMSELNMAMHDVMDYEKSRMEKGLRWLRLIAVVSPIIGIGGTLVGVIDRLRDLGDSSVPVDAGMIGGAIAPTIVTTVAGLGVGLLAMLAIACLESNISTARRRLDEISIQFSDLLNEPG